MIGGRDVQSTKQQISYRYKNQSIDDTECARERERGEERTEQYSNCETCLSVFNGGSHSVYNSFFLSNIFLNCRISGPELLEGQSLWTVCARSDIPDRILREREPL